MDSSIRIIGSDNAVAAVNGLIAGLDGNFHEPTKASNISHIPVGDIPEPKRRSNHDIVNELMNSSEFGALSEIFVVNAIRSYCNTIASSPAPEEDGDGLISNKAWHNLAVVTKERIELMYKQNEEIHVGQ